MIRMNQNRSLKISVCCVKESREVEPNFWTDLLSRLSAKHEPSFTHDSGLTLDTSAVVFVTIIPSNIVGAKLKNSFEFSRKIQRKQCWDLCIAYIVQNNYK